MWAEGRGHTLAILPDSLFRLYLLVSFFFFFLDTAATGVMSPYTWQSVYQCGFWRRYQAESYPSRSTSVFPLVWEGPGEEPELVLLLPTCQSSTIGPVEASQNNDHETSCRSKICSLNSLQNRICFHQLLCEFPLNKLWLIPIICSIRSIMWSHWSFLFSDICVSPNK